jgi:hypothetical protein
MRVSLLALCTALFVACGGSTAVLTTGDASPDGPSSDAGADVNPGDGSSGDSSAADGGMMDTTPADVMGPPCNGMTCNPGEVCVVTTTSGGPCLQPDDAGACPPGSQKNGMCCTFTSTQSACQPLPAACAGVPSCACASSLCTGCMCQGASSSEVDCFCAAP